MYKYKFNADDLYDLANILNAITRIKGEELFFKFCPYCNGGNHLDKETFSVNLKTGVFNCFRSSCLKQGHFVEMARDFNYSLKSDTSYVKLPQKNFVIRNEAIEYLKRRGISPEITKKYKITTQTKNKNILVFPFYDENNILQFVKYRNIIKLTDGSSKEWCEKNTKPILFGMNHCENFDYLIVNEGQIDTLSVAESGFKNVVSVPTGANGFTWLKHCYDWLIKFKKIIVFGDFENGKITLVDKLNKFIKNKIYVVRSEDYLFEKDANDILLKYGKQAIVKAIENAKISDVKYVKRLADVKSEDLLSKPHIQTGIEELDKAIVGLFMEQVILISGKTGDGKSTFMSQLIVEALEQNFSVFVYSGELSNANFKYWLDLQIAGGINISVKKDKFGKEFYYLDDLILKKINKWYYDKLFIFDNSVIDDDELEEGNNKEYEGVLDILEQAITRYDIKLACIDNLMVSLNDADTTTDIYTKQSLFVKKLKKIAKKYEIAIILVAHPKKFKGEFDNDSISGSQDISNLVDVVMYYERAKQGEKYDNKLSITKSRAVGEKFFGENAIKLVYSKKSKRIQSFANFVKEKRYSCFEDEEKPLFEELVFDFLF